MTSANLLSSKPIPPAERLIFALDVPSPTAARELVETLGDAVRFYKIGLELMCKCRVQKVQEVPIHFAERLRIGLAQ